MTITNVSITKENRDGKVKGYAVVEIDSMFVIRDIRIIESEKGLFVAMPSKKVKNTHFRDICHPITTEARQLFNNAVLEQYNKE